MKVKTRQGTEEVRPCRYDDLILPDLHFYRRRKGKKNIYWSDEYICLDTETSHDPEKERGWIYQWAMRLAGTYIIGRTPLELMESLRRIAQHYKLCDEKRIIIYVHNLAYDYQYLKHYLHSAYPDMTVLATDTHRILTVELGPFYMVCSYRLTNLGLAKLSETYGTKYLKAVGEVDYDIIRYPDQELTDSDWYYMLSDVAAQYDGIRGYITAMGYKHAYQCPITSTGFVRKECLRRSKKSPNARKHFIDGKLTLEQYRLCKQAFMGGITIASFLYAGETVRGTIGHKDFTSSYPARQMMDYFPTGRPMWYGTPDTDEELEEVLSRYCCIFVLTLYDVHIRPGVTAPYIPGSKCLHIRDPLKINGKVLYASMLAVAVTEIDYKWICRQYDFAEKQVSKVLIFQRGQCPQWLRDAVMEYFRGKCTLKHSDPALYMASKAKLNSIYGMSATAIIREEYHLNDKLELERDVNVDPEEALRSYYRSRNSFMSYQLGVYTTAWARDALMTMIETVGYDRFLYCDTDSVFYRSDPETEQRLEMMNESIRERAVAAGAFCGDQVLGIATDEPEVTAFRALHAKCYAMEEDGTLKVTIAGIPKRAVKWYDGEPVTMTNAEELGAVDALEDGFIFRHCGGTRSIYIEDEPHIEEIGGHSVEFASSVIIEPIEKEISDTMYSATREMELIHTLCEAIVT